LPGAEQAAGATDARRAELAIKSACSLVLTGVRSYLFCSGRDCCTGEKQN
jgi:hypothetical protein